MATRQLPVLIRLAKSKAETLRHYRIKRAGDGFMLWRHNGGWIAVHRFHSEDAAENHLMAKMTQEGL